MSTPQQQPPKGPRRSARKHNNTPNGYHPRAAVSDNELSQHPHVSGNVSSDNAQGRRKSHASHKKTNGPHRGSVSENVQPMKTQATPIKSAAYAGPTFHQSPAASALPMPSFYSKSVPNVSGPLAQPIPESEEDGQREATLSHDTPTKRESTPLDFLFQAARQARDTPRGESPSANSGYLSVRTGSPASKSPAPREPDSMFPFELDGASTPGEDGTSFATPFKERMAALNTSRPSSEGSQHLDETERRAKTDALKRFLMKNNAPPAPSPDFNNPFNARAPSSPNNLTTPPAQIRQRSGPSTPSYMQTYNGMPQGDQYFQQLPPFPREDFSHYTAARVASNLRNVYGAVNDPEPAELSSDSAISPPRISTARQPSYPQPAAPVILPGTGPMNNTTPKHKAAPSMQEMEDDLRRVLKLDLTSRG
jgi:hypothetical protein